MQNIRKLVGIRLSKYEIEYLKKNGYNMSDYIQKCIQDKMLGQKDAFDLLGEMKFYMKDVYNMKEEMKFYMKNIYNMKEDIQRLIALVQNIYDKARPIPQYLQDVGPSSGPQELPKYRREENSLGTMKRPIENSDPVAESYEREYIRQQEELKAFDDELEKWMKEMAESGQGPCE